MTRLRERQESNDSQVSPTDERGRSSTGGRLFRLGRALFGSVLAFMAVDNLRDLEARLQYAESKGAPKPDVTVPAASTGLLLGGVGVTVWRVPRLAGAAIATFYASVTPVMHDFWNSDDPDERQQELLHFLKNSALLGTGLVVMTYGRRRG